MNILIINKLTPYANRQIYPGNHKHFTIANDIHGPYMHKYMHKPTVVNIQNNAYLRVWF